MPETNEKHAVITVIGQDKVGIISAVSGLLAEQGVNIKDISQTIMEQVFTMVMLVDVSGLKTDFASLASDLESIGKGLDLTIRIQHVGIFNAMHRI